MADEHFYTPATPQQKLLADLGITMRQLDFWTRQGWLRPEGGGGPGRPRTWPPAELEVAAKMGRLVNGAGVAPHVAHRIARGDTEPAPGIRITIDEEPATKPIRYLLWANDRAAWWKPEGFGYTQDVAEAGRFTEAEAAERAIRSAHAGQLEAATVVVAAPENWHQSAEPLSDEAIDGALTELAKAIDADPSLLDEAILAPIMSADSSTFGRPQ